MTEREREIVDRKASRKGTESLVPFAEIETEHLRNRRGGFHSGCPGHPEKVQEQFPYPMI